MINGGIFKYTAKTAYLGHVLRNRKYHLLQLIIQGKEQLQIERPLMGTILYKLSAIPQSTKKCEMSLKIEPVTPKVDFGESPFWDAGDQTLYFVDVLKRTINKYTPATNSYAKASVPVEGNGMLNSIIPIEGHQNEFAVATGKELIRVRWDGISDQVEKLETIAKIPKAGSHYNFNDARVDFSGQLWIGYLGLDPINGDFGIFDKGGGLISVQGNKSVKEHLDGITLSNGLDWNQNQNKFYYVDSRPGEIYQFDYDPNNQKISNKQTIFTFSENGLGGIPDGTAIDENDNLWIANFGGGKIINIDPRTPNTIIKTVDMPVSQVTSVAFGGPNLDELYVTTSGVEPSAARTPLEGGYLYKIIGLGVRGFAGRKIKV
ncbi:hypothetical protein Trydic_g10339 [Trypoxylus dichotomus]